MDYFSPSSRHLARLRCLEKALDAIFEKRPLPEELCYVQSFELFEISKQRRFGGASGDEVNVDLDFRGHASSAAPPATSMEKEKRCSVETLLLCSRRIHLSESGDLDQENSLNGSIWLEIVGMWHKNADEPERFEKPVYLFWRKILVPTSRPQSAFDASPMSNGDVVRPFRSKTVTRGRNGLGEAGGHRFIVNRWEDVVEITYGTPVTKSMFGGCITPAYEDRVSEMRKTPSDDWDHRHDEALAQFLVQSGLATSGSGDASGAIWTHVEKIELSSSVEHMEDAIAALTDGNVNTFWETDDNESSHFIRLHMKKHVLIEKLYITVDSSDDCYLPQKIRVLAGEKDCDSTEMKLMSDVDDLEVDHSGDICIFEAANERDVRPFGVVEIKILGCKDEGIDTRIRGLKIKTKHEEAPNDDLNLDVDQDKLQKYPFLLCSVADPSTIKWRAIILRRMAVLMDSILQYVVPNCRLSKASEEQSWYREDDDDCSPFGKIFKRLRFLMPLSHKRQLILAQFLNETEIEFLDSFPKLFINRRLAISNRGDPSSTVFRQVYSGLKIAAHQENVVLKYRWSMRHDQWWECRFIGEGVIDQGGGFRDSLCDIAEELCPSEADVDLPLPYFVRAPNQHEDDHNRDTYVINAGCSDLDGYEWIGKLLGACFRTKEHLALPLTKFTWKLIGGQSVCWNEDFVTVDRKLARLIDKMQNMTREEFDQYFGRHQSETIGVNMTTTLCNGDVVELTPNGSNVLLSYDNRLEYCDQIKKCRLNEGADQIKAIRRGLLAVVPEVALKLFTWSEIERRVGGNPEISLEALKKSARYDDIDSSESRVQYLWEALEHFSNEERSKFLRFVTGRRRLPTPFCICSPKDEPPAFGLPESSTCSSTLFLPSYSSAKVCEEKLRYAVYNCPAIDTDMNPWEE